MRFYWLAVLFLALSVPAQAQTAPPFEPYTITEQDQKNILILLGEIPAKYANPIINAFAQREVQAQQEKAAADAKKQAAKAPAKK